MLQPKRTKFRKAFKGEILEHDPMAQDKKLAEADHSGSGNERRPRRDRDAA